MTNARHKPKERRPRNGNQRLVPSSQFVVWDGGRPGTTKGLYFSPEDVAKRSSALSVAFRLGATTGVSVFSTIESIATARCSAERLAIAGMITAEDYIRLSTRELRGVHTRVRIFKDG